MYCCAKHNDENGVADTCSEMRTFVQIVESGSLAAASRTLGLSTAVISRRLSALERRLRTRLVHRTTRSLSLTDEGARYLHRCEQILADIEAAEAEATGEARSAAGRLRLTTTIAFADRIAPLLERLATMHPELSIHLHASDTRVGLVEEGIDVALRFGALADSNLIARRLAPNRRVICGSPDYLARRGRPRYIDDLASHECIVMGEPPRNDWLFADGRSVRVAGRLSCNEGRTAHRWALAGAGLVCKSVWDVAEDIAAGRLETVLDEYAMPGGDIHALYAHRRYLAPRVRLCLDFLETELASLARTLGIESA